MCSVAVKTVLFKSFCMCFYGMELWKFYTVGSINRLRSCYIRCMKFFFGYTRRYSVTSMLLELHLPTFDTLLWNMINQLQSCNNTLISQLQLLWCDFILFFYTACLSGVALSFIFHVLWFITVLVCVCVCFMSMGFMPEINSCYAMLDIVVTISDRTNGRMNERTNVPSGHCRLAKA